MKDACKESPLYFAAYVWLLIPYILFLGGWFHLWISVPLIAFIIYAAIYVYFNTCVSRKRRQTGCMPGFNKKRIFLILALVFAWVIFSGIGGVFWQDEWDHGFRNGVFFDLVNHPWPVLDYEGNRQELLCYYFGFWLPSALFAKLTSSMEAGYLFQLLYAVIGASIAMMMVCRYAGAAKLRIPFIFLLFCGWDIVAYLLLDGYNGFTNAVFDLKDLSYGYFSAPSTAIQLYFIYNQGIAIWIVLMLLLKVKDKAGMVVFTWALLSIYSPIAAAATVLPVCVWTIKDWKNAFSVLNLGATIIGLLTLSFYMSNRRAAGFSLNPGADFPILILFLTLSYGVYLPFVWKEIRHDYTFWLLFGSMCILSWTRLGDAPDMGIRCAIPSFLYLTIVVAKKSLSFEKWPRLRKVLFIVVFSIGAISPLGIYARAAYHNLSYYRGRINSMKSEPYPTLFMDNPCHDNFIGSTDSFYARYLMPKRARLS